MRNIEEKNIAQGMLPGFSPPEKKTAKSKFITTEAHEAIFNAVINEKKNVQINAVAGSGKTTTMIELVRRYRESFPKKRILMTAFNKPIVKELKIRTKGVPLLDSMTMNAIGRASIKEWLEETIGLNLPRPTSDGPYRKMLQDYFSGSLAHISPKEKKERVDASLGILQKIFSHINFPNVESLMNPEERLLEEIDNVLDHHGIIVMPDQETMTMKLARERARDIALKIMSYRVELLVKHRRHYDDENPRMTFDEQIMLPVMLKSDIPHYDLVVVDEAQDLNTPKQRLLERFFAERGSQIVAVGDPHQAIYGFAGADHMSMKRLESMFDMDVHSLPVSYRIPKKVQELASDFVGHIKHRENAIDGEVEKTYVEIEDEEMFARHIGLPENKPDMVVCRFNAQLTRLAKSMIASQTKFIYKGKDFAAKYKKKIESISRLTECDGTIRGERGLLNIMKKQNKKKRQHILSSDKTMAAQSKAIEELEDTAETIRVICDINYKGQKPTHIIDIIGEYSRGKRVGGLINEIMPHYDDNNTEYKGDAIQLCTIHKAKGLEADNVVIWGWNLMPSEWAKQKWELEQESNMAYVAVTRAKRSLLLAGIDKWKQSEGHPEQRESVLEVNGDVATWHSSMRPR